MIRRLNFAGDLADPRAPDQMALVLRKDLINIKHRLITAEVRVKLYREQAAAPPPPVTEVAGDVVRLVKAARWFSREYDGFEDGDGNPCPILAETRAALAPFADRVPSEAEEGKKQDCIPERVKDRCADAGPDPHSQWVPWKSGPCPVHPDDIVDIRLGASEHEGTPEQELYGVRADDWGWDWKFTDPDIIAWRFNSESPHDGGEAVHEQVPQPIRDEPVSSPPAEQGGE